MSRHPSDSFLPSGAEQRLLNRHGSLISPMSQTPRSVPSAEYISASYLSGTVSPAVSGKYSLSQHPPMSPPKTRPESAEESAAVMAENYRSYTATLRAQGEGERAHMVADRARMEEVMAEERALWDEERAYLKRKISELEFALKERMNQPLYSPQTTINNHRQSATSHPRLSSLGSTTGSVESARSVPQESGRNADGSPFYAPAPRKPTRTFDTSGLAEMRIEDITAPRETPICVTSKELTPSDFVPSSSTGSYAYEHLDTIKETPAESIDIQLIQPELDGVSIKASAIKPAFVAHILSPRRGLTPKVSPDVKAPARPVRDITNSGGKMSPEERQNMLLEITCQPENRRLTMHAGHTPSHSMSFPHILSQSGEATPRQEKHDLELEPESSEELPVVALTGLVEPTHTVDHLTPLPEAEDESENASVDLVATFGDAHASEADDDENDRTLTGILGLTSDTSANNSFLDQLSKRLEVVAREASPESSVASGRRESVDEEVEEDPDKVEAPRLRLKPSMNFGRPMGQR